MQGPHLYQQRQAEVFCILYGGCSPLCNLSKTGSEKNNIPGTAEQSQHGGSPLQAARARHTVARQLLPSLDGAQRPHHDRPVRCALGAAPNSCSHWHGQLRRCTEATSLSDRYRDLSAAGSALCVKLRQPHWHLQSPCRACKGHQMLHIMVFVRSTAPTSVMHWQAVQRNAQ